MSGKKQQERIRKAPIRVGPVELQLPGYEGWVFVARLNPQWGMFEDLFDVTRYRDFRRTLERVVLGPWNFVDDEGEPVGEPYVGPAPEGFEGPWAMPQAAVRLVEEDEIGMDVSRYEVEGSIRELGADVIMAMIDAYQTKVSELPNQLRGQSSKA